MSVRWITHVRKHSQAKGMAKFLLFALADYANDEGVCWPSVATLADYLTVSERQCQRLIAQLEAIGEIVVERGAGRKHVSLYRIKGDIGVTFSDGEKVTSATGKGDIFDEKVTSMTGKGDMGVTRSVSNHHLEPTTKPAAAPVPALPETPTDRDGRATVQAVSDAGWLITQPERAIAANLEAQYELRDILAAVTMLTDRQRVLLGKGQRGIAKPISYLATILQETPAKPAAKPAVQYYITDPVTNERTLVQL